MVIVNYLLSTNFATLNKKLKPETYIDKHETRVIMMYYNSVV